MEDADSKDEPHEEAADVAEVVETGEEAEGEGDDDVEEEPEEVFSRGWSLVPGVEDV